MDPSSAKDRDNEAKAKGRTRRGHYGNYLSQPNAKTPKTTMYRILNTLKSEETNGETSSAMNEKLNDDVCMPSQKEFNDVFNSPVPLSSFGNDNAEIFDVNGYTCSQRSGLPGSEMHVSVLSTSSPPSLSAELHQPTDPEETSRQLTNEASIIDDVGPWHFPDSDDPAIDMEQRPMNFVSSEADEEEYSVNDIWNVEEDFETWNGGDIESEETNKETDGSRLPLFEGARLTLGASMLLVITYAMRHSITGDGLADLLLLIEVHLISPNYFGNSLRLIRNFFQAVKEPY